MPVSGKRLIHIVLAIISVGLILFAFWLFNLNRQISQQIEGGWFNPPVEIYSQSEQLFVGQRLTAERLTSWLKAWGYEESDESQRLIEQQYRQIAAYECPELVPNYDMSEVSIDNCVLFRTPQNMAMPFSNKMNLVVFTTSGEVKGLFLGEPLNLVESLYLPPQLYSQFYNGQPILRSVISVGQTPLQCLQAVTAIEDKNFLTHQGVSWTGMARAALKVVSSRRFSQGGSTITQQLVKNYFLTPEKTIRRKLIELFMAMLLENQVSKDKILESYLNVIYMGQNGPFQVIGFQAASEYYFNKKLSDLELSECALLAAVLNSPGRYNPFNKKEAALSRRKLVLEKMLEENYITQRQLDQANNQELPSRPKTRLSEPAPYYTQAVFRELEENGIDTSNGLKVYTYLNEGAQEAAQQSIVEHVNNLEAGYKSLKEKKEGGKDLQAAVISVDVETAGINALVGGRKFLSTQFNRILDGKRQVGSIMKPFVFLAALEAKTPEGDNYNANTVLLDKPFTYEYEGQSWSPRNYDKKFRGEVPMYVALKNSLNVPTAKLGLEVGLSNIIDVARRAGITSEMKEFPSLTLGAFEIAPIEVAQSYLAFPRMGTNLKLHTVKQVQSLSGEILYENPRDLEQVFSPITTADLVSMMKQTVETGTARRIRLMGFPHEAAGKTGTTSDTKDAWFAGFTPQVLTISWVGYDDNTPTGLTGSSGALPLWLSFMQKRMQSFPIKDFNWPQDYEAPDFDSYTEELE